MIGPYIFEESGVAVTVTSNWYIEMLKTFLQPKLNKCGFNKTVPLLTQKKKRLLGVLRKVFPERLIFLRDVEWLAQLSDLSLCHLFHWGGFIG